MARRRPRFTGDVIFDSIIITANTLLFIMPFFGAFLCLEFMLTGMIRIRYVLETYYILFVFGGLIKFTGEIYDLNIYNERQARYKTKQKVKELQSLNKDIQSKSIKTDNTDNNSYKSSKNDIDDTKQMKQIRKQEEAEIKRKRKMNK